MPWRLAALLSLVLAGAVCAPAAAHLERPSYWPDPAPDASISPPAGGEVPTARTLRSAVTGEGPGEVRVVCKGPGGQTSLDRLAESLQRAVTTGYRLRPSQPTEFYTQHQADKLESWNRTFAERCAYSSIQAAVNDSGNNDRVVIMPGRYLEPASRQAPTNDPVCNPSLLQEDQSGALTPSFEYQATCPNDQNLVYVQGRAVVGDPLPQPDPDRHGIPEQELGPCLRCNLQIEGSGVIPEDVLIDAGTGYEPPLSRESQPSGYAKHVVMRADRADGFVGRNFLLRGALEHGFYTEETDGILLDRVKFFWAADYGHLSFTTDHNVVRNCEGFGAGDAAVYPGAAPQTGEFRDESFYPVQRINTVIRNCDLHGNTLAYSGSMGNSVRVTWNHIYGNTNGISSDTLSAPGHPGFPSDGMEIDHNYIYSNNLNLYIPDPPFEPYVPMPIGTGIVWAGLNGGLVHDNWIFDNWRHGAVLLAVPDQVAGEPDGNVDPGIHCQVNAVSSTSCDNRFHSNVMGRVPPGVGFPSPEVLGMFGNQTAIGESDVLPNGVDFWWDEFPGNEGNCWFANIGPDGTEASITGSGAGAPPDLLPSDCATSIGNGDPVKEAVLLDCSMWARGDLPEDHPLCYWFQMPERPGTAAARAEQRRWDAAAARYAASPEGEAMREHLDEIGETAFTTRHR
jgi:hypothetical protein